METESDCGPTGALAPRGAQRPSDRHAQRPGAQHPRPGRACRPLPASDPSRRPGRELRGGARQPAAPRPQLRCPRWRSAAATGPHVPRAPPAPPSSRPRPAQAWAGRTLDGPWHRPSRRDPHHRATRAGTPGRYACSGQGSVATDLAPGGTEAPSRLPHARCGQVQRHEICEVSRAPGWLLSRCPPGDLSANPRPFLPGTCSQHHAENPPPLLVEAREGVPIA